MKIVEVKTFVVGNPPPHFGGRYFVFLKLITDGGIEGVGEVYGVPFHPDVVARMIEDVCARRAIDTDPFQIERLWRLIYSSGYTQRPDTSLAAILSGIEMACWDIVGKELNKPVYQLLGGRVHERLRSYSYLYPEEGEGTEVYRDPDRDRRAPRNQIRVRARARDRRRRDPADGARPSRRHPRGQEDRRHGRGPLRPDRAPSLLRADRGCGQHPARR